MTDFPVCTKALYRIETPYFTVGLVVEPVTRRVLSSAPIIRYMNGWTFGQVERYCRKKHWKISKVN